MKNYMELTTEDCIYFLTKVLGIPEYEIDSFLNHAMVLYEYGALDQIDLDTEEKIEDKVIDILVHENSGFTCLEDAYSAIKEIVDKIELFGKFKKDFDPSNILDYVGLIEKA